MLKYIMEKKIKTSEFLSQSLERRMIIEIWFKERFEWGQRERQTWKHHYKIFKKMHATLNLILQSQSSCALKLCNRQSKD